MIDHGARRGEDGRDQVAASILLALSFLLREASAANLNDLADGIAKAMSAGHVPNLREMH